MNNLPKAPPSKTVIFCKTCVISNQKPVSSIESSHSQGDIKKTVNFKDGICDACHWAKIKDQDIDWQARESELKKLLDKHRKNNGEYDVIVPASGGKDSMYVAHMLKEKYNMNPLTVTWKPHVFTPIGFENFMSLIDSGQSNLMFSPPGDIQRRLTSLAFKNLGHPFQPFIVGQRVVGPKAALMNNVKLVFYGENVAEYGNQIKDNYSPIMDPELYTCFNHDKDTLDLFKLSGITLKDLIDKHDFSISDFESYKSPSLLEVESAGIQVHYMSYYKKWNPQENYYYSVQYTGFKASDRRKDGSYSKYAGIDDIMEDLHFYMQVIKFGMGRCTWDAAQEVRSGMLERHEEVALVSKYDQEQPTQYFQEILEYLNISESEFWSVIDFFRPEHLWRELDDGSFSLKHPIRYDT